MNQTDLVPEDCRRAALISITACLLLLSLKFLAAHLSHSVALRSDAMESMVNVVAAVFTYAAIRFANQPADHEFPYGYGKIESLSAMLEGGLVLLASVTIGYGAVRSWLAPHPMERLDAGMILNFTAGLGNGWLGWWLVRSGKRNRSQALEADGRHATTDFMSTVIITGSLVLLRCTGWRWLDPLTGLCLGAGLGLTGVRMLRSSGAALMDAEDPELLGRLSRILNQLRPKDIVGIHQLKTLRSGQQTVVDVHLVVPAFYGLAQSHDLAEAFVAKAADAIGLKAEFRTHLDPCEPYQCQHCALETCPGPGPSRFGRTTSLNVLMAGRFHAH